MRSVLEKLKPKFEQVRGHKLDITWGLAAGLTKPVADGESPDALVAIRGRRRRSRQERQDRRAFRRDLGAVRRRRLGA
jgi:hypothetical protein